MAWIDSVEVINKIEHEQSVCNSGLIRNELEYLKALIKAMPTSDKNCIKHSKWKYFKKANIAVCVNCSFERDLDADFGRAIACPNCAAVMDLKGE